MPSNREFYGNHLRWRVKRSSIAFRAFVVEPDKYEPTEHSQLFNSALSRLTGYSPTFVSPFANDLRRAPPEPFDLVTFPEAFLPAHDLVAALADPPVTDAFGCIHVGLRPTHADQHLFSVDEILGLVAKLESISPTLCADLRNFRDWISLQSASHMFNIGCLFAVDVDGMLRACLHPKLVRSRFEKSGLPEHLMAEGNLLSVVTLDPEDPKFKTVTIQPLLCSDALDLETDRRSGYPILALNANVDCLGEHPPDHVDVVSVATCTPQVRRQVGKGSMLLAWHEQFKETFIAAQRDSVSRHHRAAFVLSNFKTLHRNEPGGLSGTYIPSPLKSADYASFISGICYGRPKGGGDNRWSPEEEGLEAAVAWESRAHLLYLGMCNDRPGSTCRIFGFTIHPLPRETSAWGRPSMIIGARQLIGEFSDLGESMSFSGV